MVKTKLKYELIAKLLIILNLMSCFSLVEIFIEKFKIPLTIFYPQFGYLMIITLFILYIIVLSKENLKLYINKISWVEFTFITTILLWLGIDYFYSLNFYPSNYFYFTLPYFWIFIFIITTLSLASFLNDKEVIKTYILFLITFFALIQILVYSNVLPGSSMHIKYLIKGHQPEALHINTSSYMCVIGVWLILFSINSKNKISTIMMSIILTLLCLLIFINGSRGAIIIIMGLFTWKIIDYVIEINTDKQTYFNLSSIINILIALILTILIIISYFLGFEYFKDKLGEGDLIRFWGLLFAIQEIELSNFWFGLGTYNAKYVQFKNIMTHTLQTQIFLSYGIMGFIFFMLSLFLLVHINNSVVTTITFSGFLVLNLIMLFQPEMYWTYALIPICCSINNNEKKMENI